MTACEQPGEGVLAALEELVDVKSLLTKASLELRKDEWREAAERTPHGQPIVFKNSSARGLSGD